MGRQYQHTLIKDDNPMKKILFASMMILLVVSVSFSQMGIKGGLNLGTFGGSDATINPAFFDASLTGLPSVAPSVRTGFAAGLTYNMGLLAGFSIEPGVMYTQRGAMYEVTIPGVGSGKGTFKLDYIEIPIVLKFSPLPLPVVKPYIEGGLSYGFLATAKMKVEGGGSSEEGDIKDGMNKSNLSILLGVGVELAIIDVNARYAIGVSKVFKDGDAKVYNRGFMLTAGIRL
jgi:hypothetical protein